jgi:adenylyl-sulfate kinase
MKSHIYTTFDQLISLSQREQKNGHKAHVFWLVGMSGAGKTTLASAVERLLFDAEKSVMVLDGDNFRSGVGAGLGFSLEDRKENIRRASETAKLLKNAGQIVLACFVCPTHELQKMAKEIVGDSFATIYIHAEPASLEIRDTKGLYKKAKEGGIENFTGVNMVFEAPLNPDLTLITDKESLEDCIKKLKDFILEKINQ